MKITIYDDVIDSRDIAERIVELEAEEERDAAEEEELRNLRTLTEEACDAPDWEYGTTLIHEDYFEDYARDLADDIGAVPAEYTWPTSCIDWKQAARELRMDYSAATVRGVTYYYR